MIKWSSQARKNGFILAARFLPQYLPGRLNSFGMEPIEPSSSGAPEFV